MWDRGDVKKCDAVAVFKTVVVYKQATSWNLTSSWEKQTSTINHSKKKCMQYDMINMEDVEFWRVNYLISNYFNKIQSIYLKNQLQKDCKWQVRLSKCTCQNQLLPFKCRKMTNEQLRIAILYLELKKREMSLQEKILSCFCTLPCFRWRFCEYIGEKKCLLQGINLLHSASWFPCRPAMRILLRQVYVN